MSDDTTTAILAAVQSGDMTPTIAADLLGKTAAAAPEAPAGAAPAVTPRAPSFLSPPVTQADLEAESAYVVEGIKRMRAGR